MNQVDPHGPSTQNNDVTSMYHVSDHVIRHEHQSRTSYSTHPRTKPLLLRRTTANKCAFANQRVIDKRKRKVIECPFAGDSKGTQKHASQEDMCLMPHAWVWHPGTRVSLHERTPTGQDRLVARISDSHVMHVCILPMIMDDILPGH